MELTTQEKLQSLPKRPKRLAINKRWIASGYASNFYQIKFKKNFHKIYQYSFQCDPPLPEQSRQLLIQVIKNAESQISQKIGIFSYKGNMLWGLKQLKTSTLAVSSFIILNKSDKEKIRQYHTIFMKIARVFDIQKDSFITDFGKKILQVLNIKFKESLRNREYIEITRNKYYTKHELEETKDNLFQSLNLRILRGFSFTFVPMKQHNLRARLNLSTKYIHQINLLELLNQCGSKDAQRQLIGRYVIAYYGNFKVYKIQDIDYEQCPLSIFSLKNEQKQMTFKDYFFEKYNKKVKDLKQPMLKVVTKTEKIINKEGKKQQIPSYGFMVPQLVKLAGLTEPQIKHKDFRQVLKFARKKPQQINVQCEAIKQQFSQINKDSVFEIGDQIRVKGYELPRIQYQTTTNKICQNEEINVLQEIMKPIKLQQKSWIMFYSEKNQTTSNKMLESMKFAQKKLGIQIENPIQIQINKRGQKDFCQAVRLELKKQKHSFVFVILNQYEQRYYSQLKRILINQFNIPSQFLKSSTVFSKIKAHKSILPIATKILLQINAKLGKPIWKILPKNQYWKNKSLLYGAFNLTKSQKSKNHYTLSFVGTSNKDTTQFYSDCHLNVLKSQGGIDKKYFTPIFTQWINSFLTNQGYLPNEIIIFRQGSNEYQALQEINSQIQGLKQVLKLFSKSQKKTPSIVYVYVNKKTDTKFYQTQERNKKGNLEYFNPLPGTVILEDLSEKDNFDFYLAAQKVTQGTCVPTFFKVLYNDSSIPEDALIQMVHQQCYNYANWNGPVRVPSCIQYASKLSSLITEHVKQPLNCSQNFKKNLFYL